MRKTQAIGLLLWRGGLWFIGGYLLFLSARYVIRLMQSLGIGITTATVGIGLLIAGCLCVFISVLLERIRDNRLENTEEI